MSPLFSSKTLTLCMYSFEKKVLCNLPQNIKKSFSDNRDPCLDDCGRQHNWVIGTELKQQKMHDESVCTPRGLQR